jgi:acyl-CoA thioesterase I
MRIRTVWPILALAVLSACSLRTVSCGPVTAPNAQAAPQAEASAPTRAAAGETAEAAMVRIAFLGDSVTSGLGVTTDQAYPNRVQEMFAAEGYKEVETINAGISGDTSAGALRRLDQVLQEPGVKLLVVAIGGNDALRGLSTTETRSNVTAIVDATIQKGIGVVLVGMEAPTNLGTDYRDAFRASFAEIARSYAQVVTYVPFLLEGVAGDAALNQDDGIHPNPKGAQVIAEHLYPTLRRIIDQMGGLGGVR